MAMKSANFGGNKMNKWGFSGGFYKGRENAGPRHHSRFNKSILYIIQQLKYY